MGYTIPGWLDDVLDFIGINFPNVDEDDYREMATAMREFAEQFEGHGGDAHLAVTRILSSSEGWAVDSFEKHWDQVKTSHLEKLPELARLFADACDVLADIIFGMKTKAEIELGVMAASVGISAGLAVVTGGLSALIGAAEVTAMRQVVKRIIDEAVDRIVDEVLAKLTEPVNAKLEAMVEDMVLDLAEGAFSMPAADGSGGHGGKGGMHIASAGGAGGGMQLASADGGAQKRTKIDHFEFEDGAGKVSKHGSELHLATSTSLGKARGAFGRSKGRDPFTQAFDSVLHGALKGSEKALGKVAKHITETVPDRAKATSRLHKGNDLDVRDKAKNIHVNKGDAGGGSDGHGGGPSSGGKGDDGLKVDSAKLSRQSHSLNSKEWCGDPIDMASGQMMLTQTDVDLPGVLPLTLRRTHLTGYTAGGFFGPSWASTLDERLEENRELGGIWWYREDGSILVYPRRPDLPGDRVLPAAGTPLPLTFVTRGTSYVLAVEDPRTGLIRHFEPAAEGVGTWWLAAIEDRNHNTIGIDRGEDDAPLAVTHTGGYRLEVTTAPTARAADQIRVTALHALTDDGPVRLRAFTYDEAGGDLTHVRNAVDAPLELTWDGAHRITGWRDSNDTTFAYEYDAQGRVTATRGTDGILNSTIAYAAPDQDGVSTATYTDSLGHATVYRANRYGQVIAIIDPLGATVTQEWDSRDHLLSRTDPLGRTTRWAWDDTGDLIRVSTPDGAATRIVYNDLHLPVELTGPDGARTRQEFDPRGNRALLIESDGATHRFTHHATGAVAAATDPRGVTTTVESNSAGLPTATTVRGATHRGRYDALGRPIELTDPLGHTTLLQWDAEGRLQQRTAHDGAREAWTWDGEGNCTGHTDPLGSHSHIAYGPFDLPATRTSPDGVYHRFRYDTEQRLTHVTNSQDLTWSYSYDPAGRLVSETDFDGRTSRYTYDAAGQPVSRTNAAEQTITYAFDAAGRLSAKTADGRRTDYRYDTASRLIGATSTDSSLQFAYDSAGRLVSQTVDGSTLRFTYDAAGRRASRITPSGALTTWTHDTADSPARLTASGHRIDFTYDAAGRELVRTVDQFATLSSTYGLSGHLTGHTVTTGTDQRLIQQRTYTHRADGHLTGIDDLHAGPRRFDLDPAGRVTAVRAETWNETYAYDAMGNQTDAAWPARHAGQEATGPRAYAGTRLTRAGNVRYEHDAQGRIVLRQKTRLSHKPDTWRYTWNAEDQLTGCTTPDGTRWRYTYDALGRRSAKLRMAADDRTVLERTTFTWDGTILCEQTGHTTGAPELLTLTWDHDDRTPVSQTETKSLATAPQESVDQRFFAIVTDQIGTPTELVDEAGTIAWRTRATLWGATTWNKNATAYTPLRFPGQYYDAETGLHYNHYRHYDPESARYLTPDPLGLLPAPNPLAYVDNPHSLSDPLGLTPCDENDVTWGDRVQYGALGPHDRATSMHATITRDMLGGKTNPQHDPAGWQSGKGYNRAHLLAAMIGGSNKDPRNFVTMHSYANSPVMRQVEMQVRNSVRDNDEIIQYSVTPIYADDNAKIPLGVTIEAHGNKGFQMHPHGSSGEGTNVFTIWNRKR
ncbi:DNA/RNA non-specific endonuclease [Streptomyces kunmingensis]|uniref:DNA/RNA non-specific endonuclease n=1 Tax=Streptomyces kunmingensis TaxID=68225 RepID=A0ABU6C4J5_9ACTN|nr:RHS repeat-associated core domain-containing protein [Streptomyces kunmingensis]MEB3959250.1 DNA/RNA non-specific endonuclease [Streptomyces kunmingensis]